MSSTRSSIQKPILIIEISPFMESNLKWLPILRIFPNCGLISKAFLRLNRSSLRIMPLSTAALTHTLEKYGIAAPHFNVIDTVKTSRQFYDFQDNKLDTLCQNLDIDLAHHHNALDDSQACARILLSQLRNFGSDTLKSFIYKYPRKR